MQQAQVLIPIDEEMFWRKMRGIIEHVMEERGVKAVPSSTGTPPQLLKVKEVCELFQISKPTIYDWIRKGQLRSLKIESRRFFLASDIEELIARNREADSE